MWSRLCATEAAIIDHTGFNISDPRKSRAFYDAALKSLGIAVQMEVPPEHTGGKVALGYGEAGKPDFWVRAHYHPSYYGAFVRDPDGHNIEAVCHTP